jgi:flagellar hook-associated protein 2
LSFVPQVGRASVPITVTSSDTLQSLADKINTAGAGVSAAVITDSTGARLSLRSASTGASNGFRITAADADGNNTDANGLSRFAYNPTGGTSSMAQTLAGADAKASVNGIDVSSASNDLSGVVSGLTLRLRKLSTDPVDVNVTADSDSIKTAITGFVDAYNALSSNIAEQTKYDAATKTAGNLQGDSTALGLQRQLRTLIGSPSSASSTFARLSDVGIAITREGTLSVNSTKLGLALGNLTELKKAFSANGNGNASLDGFARRYDQLATQVLATDGSLTLHTAGLQQRITRNGQSQTDMQTRIDAYQQRLVSQYSALDANMSNLNSLQSYMTAQLAALTKSSN